MPPIYTVMGDIDVPTQHPAINLVNPDGTPFTSGGGGVASVDGHTGVVDLSGTYAGIGGPFAPSTTGATAATQYVGGTTSGAPTTGAHVVGDWVVDRTGKIWVCTSAGTPGTWTQLGGSAAPPVVTTVAAAGASQTVTASSEVETVAVAMTLTAATVTITATGGTTGKRSVIEMYMRQDATGGRLASWPVNIQWPTGAAPVLSTLPNRTDVVQLVTLDGGASFLGALVASAYVAQAAPNAPTALVATGGDTTVGLTWVAPTDTVPSVTGYKVYRGLTSGSETLLTTLGNVTTYTDTGRTNGTTYFYMVSAVNAIGEGALSSEASAVPAVPVAALPSFQRVVTDGATTNGSPTVTSATGAFTSADVGRYISGAGIPDDSWIGTVTNGTTIQLKWAANNAAVNATATAPGVTLTIGLVAVQWFKADALALSDAAAVASWTDSSAGAQHAVQATGSLQPTFKTSIVNSLPIVRFDGVRYLTSPFHPKNTLQPKSNGSATSIFVVMKPASSGVATNAPIGTDDPSGKGIEFRTTALDEILTIHESTQVFTPNTPAITGIASSFHVIGFAASERYNNGAWGAVITINGTPTTLSSVASTAVMTATGNFLLGRAANGTDHFTGDIAEVIVYNGTLTATDRKAVEAYLGSKYAITIAP